MQGISDTKPPLSVKQLISWGGKLVHGSADAEALAVATPASPKAASLVFISPKADSGSLHAVAILVTPQGFGEGFKGLLSPTAALIETQDFRGLMSKVLGHFDQKTSAFPDGIAANCSVSPRARLGARVRISPFAVIQDDVQVGDDVWIGPGVILEKGAKIGKSSILHANVVIGHHCELGDECEIQSNTCIGSDGFGYIPRANTLAEKIPQIGRVILGHHVDIGANCCIDRGAIADTTIGDGTKIDNLSHIAHNCKIGKNCLLAASFKIAGSSEVGDFVTAGGDIVITDHVKIASHVTLGGRSAVTKDIETPGAYAGYPLVPIRDSLKIVASLGELPRFRKELAELKRQVARLLGKA